MHNSAQLRCFENGNDDFGVEAFWIGDAARVGYFVPLNGPLNGHPPSEFTMRVDSSNDIFIATLRDNRFVHAGPLRLKWVRSAYTVYN